MEEKRMEYTNELLPRPPDSEEEELDESDKSEFTVMGENKVDKHEQTVNKLYKVISKRLLNKKSNT